jgi:hypothetical protein
MRGEVTWHTDATAADLLTATENSTIGGDDSLWVPRGDRSDAISGIEDSAEAYHCRRVGPTVQDCKVAEREEFQAGLHAALDCDSERCSDSDADAPDGDRTASSYHQGDRGGVSLMRPEFEYSAGMDHRCNIEELRVSLSNDTKHSISVGLSSDAGHSDSDRTLRMETAQ